MSWGIVAFSSLLSELLVPLSDELFVNFISFLKKEVGQEVSGIVRDFFAKVNESLGQVRYNLIHQVLTDGLRSLVEKVSFVITNLLELGSITFLSLTAILCSIFVEKLLFGGFTLISFCFKLLTLNQSLNFVDV